MTTLKYHQKIRTVICRKCNQSFETTAPRCVYCPDCRPQKKGAFKYQRDAKHYDQCPVCGGKKSRPAPMCRICRGKSKRRENAHNWKGGTTKLSDGYILIRLPNGEEAMEHRVIWELAHHRKIPKGWIVHHLNGVRDDNRPENLVALPERKHPSNTLYKALQARIRELEQLHLPI